MSISRQELTALIADLVAIDSTNPDLVPGGAGEADIADFVARWLAAAGLHVETHELGSRRANVVGIARGRGEGRSLMLNAHMDVVGAGGMTEPWAPRIEDGRLYGRGSYDMKASLAAIMLVAREVAALDLLGDVTVTAVADEEFASIGVQDIVRRFGANAAIVTEPSSLELQIAHKGFVWIDVETFGVSAHGSLADVGVDAITKMGHVLTGLDQLALALQANPGHALVGAPSVHASLIQGGQELSTYPDRCLLSIERRTIPGESAEMVETEIAAILARVREADPAFRAEQRTTLSREPFAVSEREPIVALARQHLTRVRGSDPPVTGAGGWMDSAFLAAAGIPTVIFGPHGDGAHADVEWVDLESVYQTADALLGIAAEFCA